MTRVRLLLSLCCLFALSACSTQGLPNSLKADKRFTSIHTVIYGEKPTQGDFDRLLRLAQNDPNFTCQFPAFNRYFHERGLTQHELTQCERALPLTLYSSIKGKQVTWLDLNRVSEIHLLFAGKNEAPMSRFGHVALRLIVCPHNTLEKSACDENVYEHIVLGFRAHIDDPAISVIRATFGGYDARFFAQDFLEVYKGYTTDEFRTLSSVPLQLNSANKLALLEAIIETHWSHQSDYRFFTRNCTTLLQETLEAFWPDFAKENLSTYIRPDHFFEKILKTAALKGDLLTDKQQAEHDGYYFPDNRAYYYAAWQAVKEFGALTSQDTTHYLAQDPNQRLKPLRQSLQLQQQLQADKHAWQAHILIEELSYFKAERALLRQLFNFVEKSQLKKTHQTEFKALMDCYGLPAIAQGIPKKPAITNSCSSIKDLKHQLSTVAENSENLKLQWQRINQTLSYLEANNQSILFLYGLNNQRAQDAQNGLN